MWMLDQNSNPHAVLAHTAVSALTHFTVLGWRHEVSPISYSLLLVADNFSESYCSPPPLYPIQMHNWLLLTGSTRSPQRRVALCRGKPPSPRLHPTLWSAADHTQPTDLQQTPKHPAAADQPPKFLVARDFTSFMFLLGVPPSHRGLLSKGWGMRQWVCTAQKLQW